MSLDFHSLALGEPLTISASHGQGCEDLMEHVLAGLEAPPARGRPNSDAIRIAIIGRPNVGKSTLVNRLLGEERVIASDEPGTTRDSILVPFHRDDRDFLLIDTAGLRRRSKVEDVVERASVVKTLQAIAEAHVVVLVLDAHDTVVGAGRQRAGHRAAARPRADHRSQQVGWNSARSSGRRSSGSWR